MTTHTISVFGGKNSRLWKHSPGGSEAIFSVILDMAVVGKCCGVLWVEGWRLVVVVIVVGGEVTGTELSIAAGPGGELEQELTNRHGGT
jgi:hypothetical protein